MTSNEKQRLKAGNFVRNNGRVLRISISCGTSTTSCPASRMCWRMTVSARMSSWTP